MKKKENNEKNEEIQYSEDDKLLFEISANLNSKTDKELISGKEIDVNQQDISVEKEEISEVKSHKNKKKKKKKKHSLAGGLLLMTFIIAISVLLAFTAIIFAKDMLGVGGGENPQEINIPQGSSASQIANILKDEKIIMYPNVFIAFCKLNGAGANFYPGNHTFTDLMSYEDIISELKINIELKKSIKVTFKEGTTLTDAAEILEENKICKAADFIWAFNHKTSDNDYEWVKTIISSTDKLKFYKMEGFCFPDTYQFYPNSTPESVIKKIRDNFNEKVYIKYSDRIKEQGLDLNEVITLASIVQNEAANVNEMKKVASVFQNRLNNSSNYPLLQSDPTKKYVEGVIKPNIQLANEEMYTAYDTYKGKGLPPGAISNPGTDAIEAVLYPTVTDYYFFCSNIKTLEFFYAKTDAEHEINLKKAGLK